MWKKIVGNLLDKFRKLYVNGTVIWKFLAALKLKKILGNIFFSEQKFNRKNSRWVPLSYNGSRKTYLSWLNVNH